VSSINKLIFFIVLPTLSILLYPPSFLSAEPLVITVIGGLFILLGIVVWRGQSLALRFAIFTQGFNVIIRTMMFFSHAVAKDGVIDPPFIITSLLSIGLSTYLLLRLDQSDIRILMTK
jgi:hypothetical protein